MGLFDPNEVELDEIRRASNLVKRDIYLQALSKAIEDEEFTQSPCPTCKYELQWGLKHCLTCGEENPHYNKDFDPTLGEDCIISHVEILESYERDSPEMQEFQRLRIGHCYICGRRVLPKV